MTIEELMNLCIEPSLCKVEIYSIDQNRAIWSGFADDIPDEYGELEVESFDVPTDGCMTFNI